MKSIVVTGATDGIGYHTAEQLLAAGCRVIVHGRNRRKAEDTVAELAKKYDSDLLVPVWADLSDMQDVVSLADQIIALDKPIESLINNAGIYSKNRKTTVDGFEKTMAVNYFAPFLLTRLLIPTLARAQRARVINVSSMTHDGASINVNDLNLTQAWTAYDAYATSKLANVLFSVAIANRYTGLNIVSNALHPGVVTTKLLRSAFSMSGIRPSDGAKTSVYLAIDNVVEGISGQYFIDCRPAKTSKLVNDDALINAVWAATESLLRDFISA